MPFYDWRCAAGHVTEVLRSMDRRNDPVPCAECGGETARMISAPHVEPDGIYSYMPNLGSEAQFERRLDAQKRGVKVYKKEA
jgi:putative FmdB family regulatory protein